jgi:hypothetical protein
MTLAEIRAELRSDQPQTAASVITDEAFRARRAALWRRLDELVRSTS